MKYFACHILFMFGCLVLSAQYKVTISGFVSDSLSGESLIGAYVWITTENIYVTTTNEYGFFSLSVKENIPLAKLKVSYIGYSDKIIRLNMDSITTYNVKLIPGQELEEVVVSESFKNSVTRNEAGVIHLPMNTIKYLPSFFGEVDILKILQMMPGIQSGGEGSSNIHVRGGSMDQNLVLLDEVPLYYFGHLGGFVSIFNADAINQVKLIKGGFPARYGSRLSSVMDVRMKEGNVYNFNGAGTIGLLSSKVLIEGPFKKEKSSYMFSARRNIIPVMRILTGNNVGYNFYDFNMKLNFIANEKNRFYLSSYLGNDRVAIVHKLKKEGIESRNSNKVNWGSRFVNFRLNHLYNPKVFSNTTMYYSVYRYGNQFMDFININGNKKELINDFNSGSEDLSLKHDVLFRDNPDIMCLFGIQSIYHQFMPGSLFYQSSINENVLLSEKNQNATIDALENAVYAETEIKPFAFLQSNVGVRYSNYLTDQAVYHSFEPRILLNILITSTLSVKPSYSGMKQYVHLISYSGTGMPSDFWLPTTADITPEESQIIAISTNKSIAGGNYELSIEPYFKLMQHLVAFREGESFFENINNWQDKILTNGKGQSKGVELLLQKMKGNITGWVGITFSRAERTFSSINGGKSFPFKYDRPFDIGTAWTYRITDKLDVGLTWTYGSGYPVTLATEKYSIEGNEVYIYSGRNDFRMRDFHRLDVSMNFKNSVKWGEGTWNISVFNVYNRQNPFYYYFEREISPKPVQLENGGLTSIPVYSEPKLYQQSLFPFLPTVSYNFKF